MIEAFEKARKLTQIRQNQPKWVQMSQIRPEMSQNGPKMSQIPPE